MNSDKVRKMKKKQVKDELDRIKQAEKKKRRLEKALATSAAIISELEKKKLKKKEEQQRLDEEGAAIAEAVALRVLADEDSDDIIHRTIYHHQQGTSGNRNGDFAWILNAHGGSTCQWNGYGYGYGYGENGSFGRRVQGQYGDHEISAAGVVAAQAVSGLEIAADDEDINPYMFNRMVRG